MSQSFRRRPETPDIETASDAYARRFTGAVGAYFLEVQANSVLRLLKPWPHATVLDVGGGHCQLAVPLVESGFPVTVVGSSEACRTRLDSLLPERSFHFKQCNLLELPYENDSFDVVLAFRLLTHLANWQAVIGELCRVARQAVIVDYPDIRSMNAFSGLLFPAKKSIEGNTRPFVCFRTSEVLSEFSRRGFVSPVLYRQFAVPMVVHRLLGSAAVSRATEATVRFIGLTRCLGSPVIARVVPR